MTVHVIQDWEMKTACLQTSYFPEDHTGEHIAEAMQEAIASWKLQEKHLVAITTDNGSNIVKAVELNEWLRMQCFGHRLHLAIGHGMNDKRVTRAISLCKRIVSCFSYSWKKRRHLAEVQIQLGLSSHRLITESATCWRSRQQMIERVLEQEGPLAKVLSNDKKTMHLVPTWQDLEVLEAVQKVLKPLQDFKDALSGEDYVTLSYVKPELHLFVTKVCWHAKRVIATFANRSRPALLSTSTASILNQPQLTYWRWLHL
ncbi:E3 SUMO-protein ligase ZBED1-like [Siphateles boraxobius]|uniref:E3 SUMO-protein ligase ZBED1-like n=1 Tax=Siphateles boraxobius TaxID=180520 RepID=UPI004062BB55